jgi:hypothetical protein
MVDALFAVPVLLVSAAESSTGGINPFAVGAAVLALLSLAVLALLAFGAGREHS